MSNTHFTPEQRETTVSVQDHLRLAVRQWSSARPLGSVVISHGFGEHNGRYTVLAEKLVAAGLAVTRYDMRGHGKSGGKRGHVPSYDAYLDDLAEVISYARQQWPQLPMFLFGHSMGGGLVLNYALRRQDQLHGVITTGPWLRLAFQPPAWKMRLAKIIVGVLPAMSMPTNFDIHRLSGDPANGKAIENDPLTTKVMSAASYIGCIAAGEYAMANAKHFRPPLLLMHGGDDAIIDIKASEAFFSAVESTDKTFKAWPGMYHEILNEIDAEPVYQTIIDWLKKHLA